MLRGFSLFSIFVFGLTKPRMHVGFITSKATKLVLGVVGVLLRVVAPSRLKLYVFP